MAKLLKLEIRGIRSYHPEEPQELKFFSPVTLILGPNGCGKTTIIEALRYCLTGDLPTGTSGRYFVNDPKLTQNRRIKAQVKLKFQDVNGNIAIVVRSMEVAQKNNGLTFSNLDNAIQMTTATGQSSSISGRCADIDRHCWGLFNVSPSVIKNVMFCHQDNSLWPLEEGGKVKEKFDEIFNTTRYNKYADIFRKRLKEKMDNLKMIKRELECRLQIKKDVDNEKARLTEKQEKLQMLEEKIKEKQSSMEPCKNRIEEICGIENNLLQLQTVLGVKEGNKKSIIDQQETIKKNLPTIYDIDDEELAKNIEEFEKNRRKDEGLIKQLGKRKLENDEKLKHLEKFMRNLSMEIGQLNEEKKQYENKCAIRNELVQKAISTMDLKTSQQDIDLIWNQMKKSVVNTRSELVNLKKTKENSELESQNQIDSIREKNTVIKQKIASKNEQIKNHHNKITQIESELNNLNTDEERLKTTNEKIVTIEKTLEALQNDFIKNNDREKIEQEKLQLKSIEKQIDELQKEYIILTQNGVIEEKIDNEKQTIVNKQKLINQSKQKNIPILKKVFDEIPTNLKDAITNTLHENEALDKNLKKQITTKESQIATLKIKRVNCVEKSQEIELELMKNKEKIDELCDNKNFDEVINSIQKKKEKLQKDKGHYSSAKIMYEKFINEFEKDDPCCPLCQTGFREKRAAVAGIISTIRKKIEKVPKQIETVQTELEKVEDTFNKLQQLTPIHEKMETLKHVDLPTLQEELLSYDDALKIHGEEYEVMQQEIQVVQQKMEICRKVIVDVNMMDQYQQDIDRAQKSIENLRTRLKLENLTRTSCQETEAEIDARKVDLSEIKQKIESLSEKIVRHNERCQKLMQERDVMRQKQVALQNSTRNRTQFELQLNEFNERVTELQNDIENSQIDSLEISEKLKTVENEHRTLINTNREIIEKQQQILNENERIMEEIRKVHNDINAYLQKNIDKKLENLNEKLKVQMEKKEKLENAATTIISTISEKNQVLAKGETTLRTMRDNELLREKHQIEIQLNEEILKLKNEIGDFNYSTIHQEKEKLKKQIETIDREMSSTEGQMQELRASITEMMQELRRSHKKNAYKDYRDKLYEMKVNQVFIKDLEIFLKGLERSILNYHRGCMVEINKSIRNLWRTVYRGNDIDYIKIRTEDTESNAKRKTYNYKVVFVKKGVEMDMRGRCSAGQKVLACLLIRIGLAETLTSTCGILALDEPTTNLDRENITSLSDALNALIQKREKEESFQLLVITHDQDFLQTLTLGRGIAHYYNVDRNSNGYSKITKKNF